MSEFRTFRGMAIGISLLLLVAACAPSSGQEDIIATAVAQTVEAQAVQETATVPATTSPAPTDTPAVLAALTATVTATPLTQLGAGFCEPGASLVGETYPDGTIVEPGTTFTKSWRIQNTGTCVWDSTWQLIYHGGDQMGGLVSYNLPLPAQPGQAVDVPIILKAPDTKGQHTGQWMLKSPWGQSFGVGQYSVPISVSIVVGSLTPENNKTEAVFGVTAVTYQIGRRCTAANTFYEITASLTTNGPAQVVFTWVQSDGHIEKNNKLNFPEAMTKSTDWEWIQHRDSSPNPRWIQVVVTSPIYQEFGSVVLPKLCGQE